MILNKRSKAPTPTPADTTYLFGPTPTENKPIGQWGIEKKKDSDAIKVSLSDCLACSGCITSAETVLLEAQSVDEFRQQVAACDHAMVAQGAMSEHNYVLNMLPDCGHVICVECEQKSRVNMTRPHGADHYVYPCPVCAQDMPEPGGFTITLAQ